MAEFIAEFIFNPFLEGFLTQYCTMFPQLTHCKKIMHEQLASLDAEHSTFFLELFLKSTTPYEKELLAKDCKFFSHPENEFVQHLQINSIWTAALAKEDKENLWGFLVGCYLISQAKVQISPGFIVVMTELLEKQQEQDGELDIPFIQKTTEDLISKIDNKDIQSVVDYTTMFFTHDDTPLFELVPEKYHSMLEILLQLMENKEQQEALTSIATPLLENFTQSLSSDLKLSDLSDADLKDTKKMNSMISLVATSLGKYKPNIEEMMKDPQKAFAEHAPSMFETLQASTGASPVESLVSSFALASGIEMPLSEPTALKDHEELEEREELDTLSEGDLTDGDEYLSDGDLE